MTDGDAPPKKDGTDGPTPPPSAGRLEPSLTLPGVLKNPPEEPEEPDDSEAPTEDLKGAASEEQPSSTRSASRVRLYRRLAVGLTASVIALAILGGVLWSQRLALTDALVNAALRDALGPATSAEVLRVDLDEVVLANLSVPNGPSLSRVTITPTDGNPTALPLERIEIDGLRAEVTLTRAGTVEINGVTLPGDATPSDETASPLPSVPVREFILSDIEIRATTPLGLQTLRGDVSVRLDAAPALFPLTAEIALSSEETASTLLLDARIGTQDGSVDGQLDLSLQHWLPFLSGIDSADGQLALSIDLVSSAVNATTLAENGPEAVLAALNGTATLDWTHSTVALAEHPNIALAEGGISVEVGGGQVGFRLPRPIEVEAESPPAALTEAVPELLAPYLSGTPQLGITNGSKNSFFALLEPAPDDGWTIDLNAVATLGLGPMSVAVTPDWLTLNGSFAPKDLSIAEVEASLLRGPDLPRDIAGSLRAGPMDVSISTILAAAPPPELEIPFDVDASIYGPIVGPIWARQARAELTGRIALSEAMERASVTLLSPGTFTADGITGTGDLRLSPTLEMRLVGRSPLRASTRLADPLNTANVAGTVLLQPFTIASPDAAPGYRLSLTETPISFAGGLDQVELSLGAFDIRELSNDIALRDVTASATLSPEAGSLTLAARALTYELAELLPGPHQIDVNLTKLPRDDLQITAATRLANQRVLIDTQATIPNSPGAPINMSIQTAPIQFGLGGLSARDILPPALFAQLPQGLTLGGVLELDAEAQLSGSGQTGIANVSVTDGAITTPEGSIRELNTAIAFDLAGPPRTQAPFDVSAMLDVPVLGRLPFEARAAIGERAFTRIEEAEIGLFDGSIALVDSSLDPNAGTLTGTLRFRRVDLNPALALTNVSGLSAEGRLSGLIPIAVGPEGVSVTDGTLASDGGGILRIDNQTLNQALASDQQAVQLLADVLKDFHYDTLGADVTLPPAGDGQIRLSLDGRNPDVLDGHPFDLNVNLESDFRKLFDILAEAVVLSSDVLRNANPALRGLINQ